MQNINVDRIDFYVNLIFNWYLNIERHRVSIGRVYLTDIDASLFNLFERELCVCMREDMAGVLDAVDYASLSNARIKSFCIIREQIDDGRTIYATTR